MPVPGHTTNPASTPADSPSSLPHTTITIQYVTYIDYSNAAINLNANSFNTTTHTNTRSFNSSQAGATEHRPTYDGSQWGSASGSAGDSNSEGTYSQNISTETTSLMEGELPERLYHEGEVQIESGTSDSINTQNRADQYRVGHGPSYHAAHSSPGHEKENSNSGHIPVSGPNVPADIGQQPRVQLVRWRGVIAKIRVFLRRRWTRRMQR